MTAAVRILSTKKLSASQRQYLLNAGFIVTEADFIQTEPLAFNLEKSYQGLIFTSQNAVEALLQSSYKSLLAEIPCFCVGSKTQQLLQQSHAHVLATAHNAAELAEQIITEYATFKFVFFCGDLRRDELPNLLSKHQISLDEVQVYRTQLTPHKITNQPDALLFFSPSAVASYVQQNTIENAICFCIGQTTAAALQGQAMQVIVAHQPTIENTLIQAIQYYRKPQT